ncbi:MAG: malto-oligosyltrehalose trehalohydrolase, partial [Actinomycetales bacterium]|nr:malto-oligosyltrehalose trehalohydrolase [Actinomycetales bacterium]
MAAGERPGWWVAPVEPGDDGRYAFSLDGGDPRPDPRSLAQPDGVHAASALLDLTAYDWGDADWAGRPLEGSVLYELHVGTFTAEGTFAAAIERLDHLVDLGVTTVTLMPVAAFPGRHGWGYDGVALFAVHEPYGGARGLQEFVDACHRRGLAVHLDVVYNHLGPSGNYLGQFGPYFTDRHHTPWGQAVNLDAPGSDEVRAFLLDNARMWLTDFHLDGLRLDAVHALYDDRAEHLLEALATLADEISEQ